ncbi:MAG TPA: twin-arginine translocation signal domain-containing protein, partial [Xanthobacteraceae bacterium]|nr:twin-arginine translocation signal domain-containing protein [Xanthobacteraceae bacterium]
MLTRRKLLEAAGAGAIFAGPGLAKLLSSPAQAQAALKLPPQLPDGTREEAILDALPGKKPLIKLSYRPPNYETPLSYFAAPITPN